MDIIVYFLFFLSVLIVGIILAVIYRQHNNLFFLGIELQEVGDYIITMSNSKGKRFKFRGYGTSWERLRDGKVPNKKLRRLLINIYQKQRIYHGN